VASNPHSSRGAPPPAEQPSPGGGDRPTKPSPVAAAGPPLSKRELRKRLRDAGQFARAINQAVEGLDPSLACCSAMLVAKSLVVATLIRRLETLPVRELLELVRSLDAPVNADTPPRGQAKRKPGILPPEFPEIVRSIYGVDIDTSSKTPAQPHPAQATAAESSLAI